MDKGGFLRVGIDRLEIFVTAEENLTFFFQLGQPFQAGGLLRFVHHRSYVHVGVPGITDFHGAQTCSNGIAKGLDLLTRNQDAPDGGAFLAGFQRHFADNFLCEEVEQIRAGSAIRAKNGGVNAVCFDVHANRTAQDIRVGANARRSVG